MNKQIVAVFYRLPGAKTTEHKALAFDIHPSKTPVIVRECFHLVNNCIAVRCSCYRIEVNGVAVVEYDPDKVLNIRKAVEIIS